MHRSAVNDIKAVVMPAKCLHLPLSGLDVGSNVSRPVGNGITVFF